MICNVIQNANVTQYFHVSSCIQQHTFKDACDSSLIEDETDIIEGCLLMEGWWGSMAIPSSASWSDSTSPALLLLWRWSASSRSVLSVSIISFNFSFSDFCSSNCLCAWADVCNSSSRLFWRPINLLLSWLNNCTSYWKLLSKSSVFSRSHSFCRNKSCNSCASPKKCVQYVFILVKKKLKSYDISHQTMLWWINKLAFDQFLNAECSKYESPTK